jgi:hypothetical protein
MCKITLLKGQHLVDASKDKERYAETYAKQGCMKREVIAQQSQEKDWQAEATPHEQIPKQKHPQLQRNKPRCYKR